MGIFSFLAPLSAQRPSCDFPIQCRDGAAEYKLIWQNEPNQNYASVSWLIAQQLLLPANLATSQAQAVDIRVRVLVDIDYTFASASELVFSAREGSLEVPTPTNSPTAIRRLNIQGSHLHGCKNLWEGIYVRERGRITANQCCIEDGVEAIRLYDGARFDITQNVFRRNFVSIFGGGVPAPGNLTATLWMLGKGISGNEFIGSDNLKQIEQNKSFPYIAVEIINVAEFTFGFPGGAADRNDVHDYGTIGSGGVERGLYLSNTGANVVNSRFYNFGSAITQSGGVGIYSSGIGAQFLLNVTGLGEDNILPTFDNCETGIQGQDIRLKVTNCRFRGGFKHIQLDPSFFGHRFTITDNRFEQFAFMGVNASKSNYNSSTMTRNRFEDFRTLDYPGATDRVCVNLNGNLNIPVTAEPPVTIFDNRFFDMDDAFDISETGVSLTNLRSTVNLSHNFFEQNDIIPSQTPYIYNGINVKSCFGNLINGNNFSGISSGTPLTDINGIRVFESPNIYKCNTASTVQNGFQFSGSLCNGSDIRGNVATGNKRGLMLNMGTVVGLQFKKGNRWPGDALEWEAFHGDAGTVNPSLSTFVVHVLETPGSEYWPQPRNAPGWFTTINPEPPNPTYDFCVDENGGGNGLTTMDEYYLNNTLPPYRGYNATVWEAGFFLYNRLHHNPGLMNTNAAAAAFYANNTNSNLGRLHQALEQYGALWAMPASIVQTWENNLFNSDAVMAALAANQTALMNAATPAEVAQLEAERTALNAQLQALIAERQGLAATHIAAAGTKIAQLQAHLSSISPVGLPENNLKTVLSLMTDVATTQGPYTASQVATLEGIAGQCRFAGGYGVVLARTALEKNLAQYDDIAMCPPQLGPEGGNEDRTSLSQTQLLHLAPNPGPGEAQLSIPNLWYSFGMVRVFNSTGLQVLQMNLSPGSPTVGIDLRQLPNGVYFVQTQIDGTLLPSLRMIKSAQ